MNPLQSPMSFAANLALLPLALLVFLFLALRERWSR